MLELYQKESALRRVVAARRLWQRIETRNDRFLFTALVLSFLIFYAVQIPQTTSNSDVLVFACKAASDTPDLHHAYLDERTLLQGQPLPNYHLGHTLFLWAIYRVVPESARLSIWPAGAFSAICGALVVGVTFLIWRVLRLKKHKALISAVVVGFIPSIWYHSLIGEIYVPQLLFILLFAYFFLSHRIVLSGLAFLIANLISPLSGLAFSMVLLAPRCRRTVRNAVLAGGMALALYVGIYYAIGSNVLTMFDAVSVEQPGRGFAYRVAMLTAFIVINLNAFLLFAPRGLRSLSRTAPSLLAGLSLAVAPQLVLLAVNSTFFIDFGCFQLLLFWGLAGVSAIGLSEVKKALPAMSLACLGSLAVTILLWLIPNRVTAEGRLQAGRWLTANASGNPTIIGDWQAGIPIALLKAEWDYNQLCDLYRDRPLPTNQDLDTLKNSSAVIVTSKKSVLRRLVAKVPLNALRIPQYNPAEGLTNGEAQKIFENSVVVLYSWQATQ